MNKLVSTALLALAAVSVFAQQTSQTQPSLGDVARQQRAQDKSSPKKVWTDEDFPSASAPAQPSSEAHADANPTEAKPEDGADKDKEAKATDAKDGKAKEASADEQAKLDAEWKTKVDAQKSKIADLQRDYELTDREYKLFNTTYYADAGNRLRDQKDFHDKDAGYREKMSGLKEKITNEQAKLAEMQEQAHKAGADSKAYD